jgi:NTP pyrophosphatase (non-canonical NTP hydrolase)
MSAYTKSIFKRAEAARKKAQIKHPQPNYVCLKVAEEAGEVVQAAVHYREGRKTWADVEGEAVDAIAMIMRLLVEGDHVNGIYPPSGAL